MNLILLNNFAISSQLFWIIMLTGKEYIHINRRNAILNQLSKVSNTLTSHFMYPTISKKFLADWRGLVFFILWDSMQSVEGPNVAFLENIDSQLCHHQKWRTVNFSFVFMVEWVVSGDYGNIIQVSLSSYWLLELTIFDKENRFYLNLKWKPTTLHIQSI